MHGFCELERTIQGTQCKYKRNIEARSGNHCCSGKFKVWSYHGNLILWQFY